MAGSALGGMASSLAGNSVSSPTTVSGGGKGGIGGSKVPTGSQPAQGQYAPLSPQGSFNVNQAAAGGLQQAMQGTQQAMGFQPQQIGAATYNPQAIGSQGYNAAQAGSQGYNAATAGSQGFSAAQAGSQGYNAAQAGSQGYGASGIAGASPIRAQNVQAGQVAGSNLGAYTNPYENQVVQQSLGDLERSRQMQQNVGGAQASASGAFGGSRHGIAEAETNRAFAKQAADTAAQLRQGGYTQAQNLAGQDVGFTNQASQFGAGAQNASMVTNQQAGMQASQNRLSAASQLGQLGQQAFDTGQTIQSNQMQQGLMQQGLQQALIDAARGQYAGYTGSPGTSLNAPLAALGVAGPSSGSTTTQTSSPGLFDYFSTAAMAAAKMSDPRLKTNIKPRGEVGGVNFYDWEWNDEGKRIADPAQPTFGVMADELQKTHPHLVKRGEDGYLRVNYNGLAAELEVA